MEELSEDVRQPVEQKSAGEPLRWYAVCPLSSPFWQCAHNMFNVDDDGRPRCLRPLPSGITE